MGGQRYFDGLGNAHHQRSNELLPIPSVYHQGTVWPLYTGWVSVAEYRAGQDIAGYAHLMQNANLTWAQDPGDVTELLSGQFYQVLGGARRISCGRRNGDLSGFAWTIWAGVECGRKYAECHSASACAVGSGCDSATAIRNRTVDLSFRREGGELVVQSSDPELRLDSRLPGARSKRECCVFRCAL